MFFNTLCWCQFCVAGCNIVWHHGLRHIHNTVTRFVATKFSKINCNYKQCGIKGLSSDAVLSKAEQFTCELFLSFLLSHFAGDLLENYCYDDMNFARVLFCVSILLTFPLECFVAREVSTLIRRENFVEWAELSWMNEWTNLEFKLKGLVCV